jgi:hypothetical protein
MEAMVSGCLCIRKQAVWGDTRLQQEVPIRLLLEQLELWLELHLISHIVPPANDSSAQE